MSMCLLMINLILVIFVIITLRVFFRNYIEVFWHEYYDPVNFLGIYKKSGKWDCSISGIQN